MNTSEIFNTLRDLLKNKFSLSTEHITPETTLTELGLDSLYLMEFVFAAEDAFALRIPEEDLDPRVAGTTLGDIANIIEQHLLQKKTAS